MNTDSERILARAAFEKALSAEPMTGDDMTRLLQVLQSGVNIYSASPDEIAGLRERLIGFLTQWQNSLQQK